MPKPTGEKPEIRLLHHMARTGGTVICRCLSAMEKVFASQRHPLTEAIGPPYRDAIERLNPLGQAIAWYDLLTEQDKQRLEPLRGI